MPYDQYLEVETLDRPSTQHFRTHFLDRQRPVKITGGLDHWPAMKTKPWSLDYFEARYGNEVIGVEKFEPGERGDGRNSPQDYVKYLKFQDMKVADLINVLKTRPDHMYYMAQHPFRKCFSDLREDIGDNPYLKGCIQYVPGAHMDTYLWIGPKGTLTPIHQDPMPNFLIQVMGRKLVHLFPANEAEKNLYIGQFERPAFSPVDVENPDLDAYPNYRDCTHYQTILEPGQMLHIPRNWGHAVRSLDISISLSSFFLTYGLVLQLLPEYVSLVTSRIRQSWRSQQANERARVNPPPPQQH